MGEGAGARLKWGMPQNVCLALTGDGGLIELVEPVEGRVDDRAGESSGDCAAGEA